MSPVGHYDTDDLLPTYCWCGAKILRVSPADVRAGKTRACRLPTCFEGCKIVGSTLGRPKGSRNRASAS